MRSVDMSTTSSLEAANKTGDQAMKQSHVNKSITVMSTRTEDLSIPYALHLKQCDPVVL